MFSPISGSFILQKSLSLESSVCFSKVELHENNQSDNDFHVN